MVNDKMKKEYKKQLERLRDAYAEVLGVFHSSKYYTVSKQIHEAIFHLDRAIKYLEVLTDENS